MGLNQFTQIVGALLWPVAPILTAVLALTLSFRGMARAHPFFLLYLVASALEGIIRLVFGTNRLDLYITPEIALLCLSLLILRNVCQKSLEPYPALAKFAGKAMYVLVIVGVAIGGVSLWANPAVPTGRSAELHHFEGFLQAGMGGLFAFILLFTIFLGWYPVRVSRNNAIILWGFGMHCALEWVLLLAGNFTPQSMSLLNIAEMGGLIVIVSVWLTNLTAQGEVLTAHTGHWWDPAAMEGLTRQLASMNTRLSNLGA